MIMIQPKFKNKWYKISEENLLDLLRNNIKLEALVCGGVDNWDWYGQSIQDYLHSSESGNYTTIEAMARDGLKDFERIDINE